MNAVLAYGSFGVAAYLLGAVPFGYLIARARGIDIREQGSGNIGTTNVFRCVGKGWGILTLACDAAKGFIPAFVFPSVAAHLGMGDTGSGLAVVCGCMAVAGHNWPVYLAFKGGKGVATTAGALLGLAPAAMGIGLLLWIAVLFTSRYVSVASMLTALLVACLSWFLYAGEGFLLPSALSLLGVVAVWRHKANIRRLLQGTEHRFAFGRKQGRPGPTE